MFSHMCCQQSDTQHSVYEDLPWQCTQDIERNHVVYFSASFLEHGETESHASPQTEENVSALVLILLSST